MDSTKKDYISSSPSREADFDTGTVTKEIGHEESEVFGGGEVNFRTVGWIRASTFLIKQTFATGVLSMPSAMYFLGAVPGTISIVVWGAANTYLAYVQVRLIPYGYPFLSFSRATLIWTAMSSCYFDL